MAKLEPHFSELLPGELALNYSDMILYALDSGGNVQQVSSSGGGGGGDLVAMDYTFWVRVIPEDATGEALVRFRGPDDAGRNFDPNLAGFDVGLNGVSLIPDYNDGQGNSIEGDYSLDDTTLDLHEPAKPGDVVIIRSLKASDAVAGSEITTNDVALLGEDTTLPVPQEYKDWLTRNSLKTQQDANWHLWHKIEDLNVLGGYNDAWIQPAIDSGDATSLADAKDYTDQEIAAIPPTDLSDYATKQESTDGDVKALDDSKKYTDQKIGAIVFPPGTIVKDTEPQNVPNGTNWFDTVRLELFVRASDSWLPSSPLGARVSQGEIVQAELVDRVTSIEEVQSQPSSDVDKEYVDAQDATKMGNTGDEILPTSKWKLRAPKIDGEGTYSYISIQDDGLRLYHVTDPTADAHGMSRGYADTRYQFIQKPIGFKIDQSATCSLNPIPSSGEFCGLNNSSPGSSTSPNNYFGNFNAGIRVHSDKLLNPEGNRFQIMERYSIAGTVSILGKDTGKLYFRHGISAVVRESSHEYVELIFATRIPTFGTGAIDAEAKYIVIVDGLESVQPATASIPEETE